MNPRAEAMLSARARAPGRRSATRATSTRLGLEAIEQIEIIAAELAAEVFGARYAEVRVGSGALANLYAFMATCRPGDTIIAPPAEHRRPRHPPRRRRGRPLRAHHRARARSTPTATRVDVDALRKLAHEVAPDADHHRRQPQPLPAPGRRGPGDRRRGRRAGALRRRPPVRHDRRRRLAATRSTEGAHLMTMSTYKSLGGPPGGLIVTNDAEPRRAPRRDRLPGADRELRRRQDRRARGRRCSTGRSRGRPTPRRWSRPPVRWPPRSSTSGCRSSPPTAA